MDKNLNSFKKMKKIVKIFKKLKNKKKIFKINIIKLKMKTKI